MTVSMTFFSVSLMLVIALFVAAKNVNTQHTLLLRNCFTIMESIQVAVSVLILFLVNLNVLW